MNCLRCDGQLNLVEVRDGKYDNDEPCRVEIYVCEDCGYENTFYEDVVDDSDLADMYPLEID